MTADPAAAYASLAELRAVQARLGELRRKSSETAALWDAAADFVRRGAATGVVLDSDDERWSVQGLLDYWASALERAGRPRRIGLIVPDVVAKVSLVRFERVPSKLQELDQLVRWQVRKSAPFAIEEA